MGDFPICVTGVSGFLAGEIVKQLYARGFTNIRGTTRDKSKYGYLIEIFPKLQLYNADLLVDGSFDEAIHGCEIVFHTASPFFMSSPNWQKDLIEPALEGTKNVLRSVDRAGTVKRVVLTSSVAAVAGVNKSVEGYVFSEKDFNSEAIPEKEPYRYSKYIAEKAAWDLNEGKPWKLVTICPSFIMGPVLSSRADATSIKLIKSILEGDKKETGAPPICIGRVDLRDVARAHIEGAIRESAHGRYIISSNEGITELELCNVIRDHPVLAKYPIPTHESAPFAGYRLKIDTSKAKNELGVETTHESVKRAAQEMALSLIEFGIVKRH